MNDDEEAEVARIEQLIAELEASTEVVASCRVVETVEGEAVERELVL